MVEGWTLADDAGERPETKLVFLYPPGTSQASCSGGITQLESECARCATRLLSGGSVKLGVRVFRFPPMEGSAEWSATRLENGDGAVKRGRSTRQPSAKTSHSSTAERLSYIQRMVVRLYLRGFNAGVAQWQRQRPQNPFSVGSTPTASTTTPIGVPLASVAQSGRGTCLRSMSVGVRIPPEAPPASVAQLVEQPPCKRTVEGSKPSRGPRIRSVAQSGRAPASGAGGPTFESWLSDHAFVAQWQSIRPLTGWLEVRVLPEVPRPSGQTVRRVIATHQYPVQFRGWPPNACVAQWQSAGLQTRGWGFDSLHLRQSFFLSAWGNGSPAGSEPANGGSIPSAETNSRG